MFKTLYSVALDGNPEPDLVHATGCKQPTLRSRVFSMLDAAVSDFFYKLYT
jgi:hypothetical protein